MPAEQDALFPGKQFISTVLEALETKTRMTGVLAHRYLMRAAMAGMVVAVFYIVNYAIVGVFDGLHVGDASLAGIGKLLGALAFGPALVFIYYTKSELLTSNMMVVVIGYYYKRISAWRVLRVLVMCLAGNFVGGLVFAVMYRFSTLVEGATGEQATHSVAVKLHYLSSASGIGGPLRAGDPVQLHDQPGDAPHLQRIHPRGLVQDLLDDHLRVRLRLPRP